MRPSQRAPNELRELSIQRHYTCHADGSVLISLGRTQVLCNASLEPGVPRFLRGKNRGWLTAEYGMLPYSTNKRMRREAASGHQGGRTIEIQRLIGRSLRAVMQLAKLGEYTMVLDCDVIQADGGTRTAAITGACVAMVDALRKHQRGGRLTDDPLLSLVAAVSVGIYQGQAVLDMDYAEDSAAETDMNVVMNNDGLFIEVQGAAEARPFADTDMQAMLALAREGIAELLRRQEEALRGA